MVEDQAQSPPLPAMSFAVGVTGHRATHPSFPADTAQLDQALHEVLSQIDAALEVARGRMVDSPSANSRLITLLADGADHHAARAALHKDWDLLVPLPFGRALNAAINANPRNVEDTRAILDGKRPLNPETARACDAIDELAGRATVFELADDDERLSHLFTETLSEPSPSSASTIFWAEASMRAELAGRILIEQSDLVIALWDGQSTASIGGTGHTLEAAINEGVPVLLMHPDAPADWTIIDQLESLSSPARPSNALEQKAQITALVERSLAVLVASDDRDSVGLSHLKSERWRAHSSIANHPFRRIEAVFGEPRWLDKFSSIKTRYLKPQDAVTQDAGGLLAAMRSILPSEPEFAERMGRVVITRFAWLDAVASVLSDRHRSGMTINFLLGAAAIIGGILYVPLVGPDQKWIFAGIELLLLLLILVNTAAGRKMHLHQRWFQTRRAAEYLRHSPIMAAMGVARTSAEWPFATDSTWPEWYARNATRALGVPQVRVDKDYLKAALSALRDHHVEPQRKYHTEKAERLARVHHHLDTFAERLFIGAVFCVALYLVLFGLSKLAIVDGDWLKGAAKWFTVLAVALPSLGSALAGIRFFGDFERMAEISEVAASRLDTIGKRIETLLTAPDRAMTYRHVAQIMRATDQAVIAELEAWQSVFSSKVIAVPA